MQSANVGYSGAILGTFGVAAGVGALFFLGEVPRVRRDILQQLPFLDQYYDRRIAPEDNVSFCLACPFYNSGKHTNMFQPF